MGNSSKKMLVVWLLAFVAVILNFLASRSNMQTLREHDQLVAHTRDVQKELVDVLSLVKDAESSQRGYQITEQDRYLESFERAAKMLELELTVLKNLTQDNPEQVERANQLGELIQDKLNLLRKTIAVRKASGEVEAEKVIKSGSGFSLMNDVQKQISAMDRVEEDLYQQRINTAENSYLVAAITNIVGGFLILFLVGGAYRLVHSELKHRKTVERKLRETNQHLDSSRQDMAETLAQLDAFLQNAPVGISFFDPNLRYVRANHQIAEMNRLPLAAHWGKTPRELRSDFPEEILQDFKHSLATGERIPDRILHIEQEVSGKKRVWRLSIFPVRDNLQKKIGLGVIALDITEQLHTEQQIRDSEAFFRSVLENSPDCIKILDREGRIQEMNSPGRKLMQIDDFEQIKGRQWESMWTPEQQQDVKKAFDLATSGSIGRFSGSRPTMKGTPKYWDVQIAPIPGPDGTPFRYVCVSRDVTEHRKIEVELRESLERFRLLTEAIPQMVWATDASGQVTYYNRRWIDHTGVTVELARNLGWRELVHPEDLQGMHDAWEKARQANSDHYVNEFRLRGKSDPNYRWMLTNAVALRETTGEISQWVGTMTDIHEQKLQSEVLERLVELRTSELLKLNRSLQEEVEERSRAEEREKNQARELRRSNEELEKFAYVASHDLQEPLRKIQAFGNRLTQKYQSTLGEEGQNYIERMLDSSARMRRLIDDLLAFSRVTTKPGNFEMVDLNLLVQEVLSDLEGRLLQTGGQVIVGKLPKIQADALQMRQLFQNLIGNALKFHKVGVPPEVNIASQLIGTNSADNNDSVKPACYRVDISDNGIGFDEKYLDRIFEVFQRLHGRDEYEGTGVGLAICRKIVERHRGSISAKSQPGQGATFEVTIPSVQI
ncbi:PAS domain-containing protein [Telmatocola sphagniphila]|uniref:histidine kinase n=1 Tax=Telmatocola sphagniphila TaxID=1123043 RepID=A0A8E6EX08_9BACT|nr:PAS domain-containing protein [Telmatocola sphagniphila]QVL34570.1 PAS domain-containing protein [Telmatocola sphagniphila]